MNRKYLSAVITVLVAGVGAAVLPAAGAGPSAAEGCGPGTRTLSRPGAILYPETGNGGYLSDHTDVKLVYDSNRNRFLAGTAVELELTATRCLTELSLDFEAGDPGGGRRGPRLRVRHVAIDGAEAGYRFVRPTYPGDPKGQDDPDPRAHQMAQQKPVGGPKHNPLPPACSPSLGPRQKPHARDGRMCPKTKLVVVPEDPVPAGDRFTVRIEYTGRPGTHRAPDGAREGWWRAPHGGVTNTEPIGTQAWMPLNNHPSAKPTYDFRIRTQRRRTAIASGEYRGTETHPPDRRFRHGSKTVSWHSPDPIASYLPMVLVGRYFFRKVRRGGITYRLLQDRKVPARERPANWRILRQLPRTTRFLGRWNGTFPFTTDGAAVTIPGNDDMEMQTLIIFGGGGLDLPTLYHENMHEWWGDEVSQASYNMVFFKEGLATFAEILHRADADQRRRGGKRAFRRSLVRQFTETYGYGGRFWRQAPSHPRPNMYFSGASTYLRPGAAYTALYLNLGRGRFKAALRTLRTHAGGTVNRRQWQRAFTDQAPNDRCRTSLNHFFRQWFDTRYRPGKRPHRPRLTAPGLPGRTPPGC